MIRRTLCRLRDLAGLCWADRRLAVLAWWDARRGYPWLHARFRQRVGYDLDLVNPVTMNQKIQWRKIHDRQPLYRVISDKYAVRSYVARKLGKAQAKALFPPLLGTTRKPDADWLRSFGTDVTFKATHGSGWNLFVRAGDTPDYPAMAQTLRGWLRQRYARRTQEWAYWGISPRVVAEKLLLSADGKLANDLKFAIFRGKCGYVQIDIDRQGTYDRHFMTPNWQFVALEVGVKHRTPPIPRPPHYAEMLALAKKLGRDFDFIRVDFLYTEDRFALNELTLYRGSGMNAFKPRKYDRIFGDMWVLPNQAKGKHTP